nr:MAG TPA: hypothetical protein [Caudoviricetes sp.]
MLYIKIYYYKLGIHIEASALVCHWSSVFLVLSKIFSISGHSKHST